MENIKKVKYFLVCALAILFLLLGASFVSAAVNGVGGHCGGGDTCESGLECHYSTCHKPIGDSCSRTDSCCPGCGFIHCESRSCCGAHGYPCGSDSSVCCDDYHCSSSSKTCRCSGASCTAWVNQGCGQGGCAANQMYQNRTCQQSSCSDDPTEQCIDAAACSCSDPSVPTLINPPHDIWINDDPTFQANSANPGGDQFRTYFEASGFGSAWGSWVNAGENSSLGPIYLSRCGEFWWRGYSENDCGKSSAWSGWQLLKVDKNPPTCSIDYPTGIINTTTFTVNLTEDDTCSGIKQGLVQISVNNGNWASYSTTISDFNYTGSQDNCYRFRYRVEDNAGIWSKAGPLTSGGEVCIDVSKPTASIIYPNTWINSAGFNVQLTENDPNGSIANGNVDIMIKAPDGNWPTSWSDYATTIDDFNYAGQNCNSYRFRYQVTDNAGNLSDWADPGYITQIDTQAPITNINYPSGTINSLSFAVVLTESDDCSDIKQGNVQISKKNGAGQDYRNTISDFTYNGQNNACYRFRYNAQDNAGNWSNWAADEEVCIDFSVPTCSINYPNGWINSADFNVELTEDDPGGSIANGNVDILSKHRDEAWLPNWSDHANTIDDFTYAGQNCYFYKFRYQVTDNAGNVCPWADPGYVTQIDTDKPTANINYPGGTINQVVFNVNLTESDGCSGIKSGEVQVSTDGGEWQPYAVTVNDFQFTGSFGHSYKFRYQVQDNVDNFSDWVEGPTIYVEALPVGLPGSVNWIFCPDIQLELNWDYSDISNLPQIAFQIQIDDNDNFSSPTIDTGEIARSDSQNIFSSSEISNLLNGTKYYWQVRVRNSANDWSGWSTNPSLTIFFDLLEGHSSY